MENEIIGLLIEAIIAFIFTIILYFYYIKKNANLLANLISILIWFCSFVLIILLTYDISNNNIEQNNKLLFNILTYSYKSIYWIIFINAWIFLPLLTDYELSGELTIKNKFKASIRSNLIFYSVIFIIAFVGGIIFLINYYSYFNNFKAILGFFIEISNMFGLLLVMLLLGFSLAKVSKDIYRYYDINNNISFIEWNQANFDDDLIMAQSELIDNLYKLQTTVFQLKNSSKYNLDELIPYTKEIIKIYDDLIKKLDFYGINLNLNKMNSNYIQTLKEFTNVNYQIKKNCGIIEANNYKKITNYKKWLKLKSAVVLYYDKVNINNNDDDIRSNLNHKPHHKNNFIPLALKKYQILYYIKIRPILILIIFFFSILFATLTLISETILFTKSFGYNINPLGYIIKLFNKNVFLSHLSIVCPIIYIYFMCFYTIFNFKLSGYFGMYGNRHTDITTILYLNNIMTKIVFSICINVIQCYPIEDNQETIFTNNFFNHMYLKDFKKDDELFWEKLYKYFNFFCPIILFILVLLNYYNVFGKCFNLIGISTFSVYNEEREQQIETGREDLYKMTKNLGYDLNNYKILNI